MKDYMKLKKLDDDALDMVSGGMRDDDDNTKCQWNPDGSDHVFEEGSDGRMTCKYCGVYY